MLEHLPCAGASFSLCPSVFVVHAACFQSLGLKFHAQHLKMRCSDRVMGVIFGLSSVYPVLSSHMALTM